MASTDLHLQAINQALAGNWKAALDLNLEALKKDPRDIDVLCRLAKAYTEMGKKRLAQRTYRKILRLDKFNPIAKKNLLKFDAKVSFLNHKKTTKIDPCLFLEEEGKTKIVSLTGLTTPKIILEQGIGDPVNLISRKHSIAVYDSRRRFLGKIPDDLSARLIKLIKNGNLYQAVIKSVEGKNLFIFIKEVKQSNRNANLASFPFSKEQYHSFVPLGVIKRDLAETSEELQEEVAQEEDETD